MAGLFGGTDTPPLPEVPKPTPMSDPEAIAREKRKAALKAANRGGRASTILSEAGAAATGTGNLLGD